MKKLPKLSNKINVSVTYYNIFLAKNRLLLVALDFNPEANDQKSPGLESFGRIALSRAA